MKHTPHAFKNHLKTESLQNIIHLNCGTRASLEPIRIGTRGSALALAQTTLVKNLLCNAHPNLCVEEKIITTIGDANPSMPLHKPVAEASGLFTRQLEDALLDHSIDAAVHSLKDLPVTTPAGLTLAAILPRASTSDLLITPQPGGIAGLPSKAFLGTSSPRRTEILRKKREDLRFTSIRGNVPTRLRKLAMNQREHPLDGIVLARAGLERLGYDLKITNGQGEFLFDQTILYVTEFSTMLPAPGQGAIAIETRHEQEIINLLAPLHDEKTAQCVTAERLLLHYLGGGCHMALGALATIDETSHRFHLKGIYFPYAGATPRQGEATGRTPEEAALLVATQLGDKLAAC
ncbi:MAG: hydroxymethylbilane synthase [Chthoniobacterales bacterium]|nr:hydroxymethylbilane synthase [Chthoniobacterales bacterium]